MTNTLPPAGAGTPAIEVEGLVKRFGVLRAVDNVSFSVAPGSVTGFIGANGAGKTTTMRILSTLETADAGMARVCGLDVADRPAEVRPLLGWMPDSFGTYDNMSVWEYLDFFARAYGFRRDERRARVEEVMEFTDLKVLADRPMNKLSKGMGQRLCLGRTLLHDPQVLILDEPAAGLDPKARLEFKRLVRLLSQEGKTILISSHILSELAEMCDSLLFIDRGRIIHHGEKEALTRNAGVGAMFDVLLVTEETGPLREAVLLQENAVWSDSLRNGGRVTLRDGSDAAAADLLRHLVAAGLPIVEFKRVERRLEEAFVDVVASGGFRRADSSSTPPQFPMATAPSQNG